MPVRSASALLFAGLVSATLAASAREVLTPEEQAERELARRRAAPPVLVCEPTSLRVSMGRGETRALRATVRNAGGGTLSWAVMSAPKWIVPDRRAGELGFGEKRSLVLTVDPEGLGPGATLGEVVVEARDETEKEAEGSPVTVAVAVLLPGGEVRPAEEEKPAIERPPPREEAPAAPAEPGKPRSWRMGLHAGLLSPLAGDAQSFEPGPFGLFVFRVALPAKNGSPRRTELEFAEGWSEFDSADAADSSSRLIILRARGLFPVGPERLYLTAGGGLFSEEADYPGADYEEHVRGTIDLGAIVRLGGRFELGASYSIVIGSKNVPGMFEVGAGVTF